MGLPFLQVTNVKYRQFCKIFECMRTKYSIFAKLYMHLYLIHKNGTVSGIKQNIISKNLLKSL